MLRFEQARSFHVHSGELNHALSLSPLGGPTQLQLSRLMSSGHHISMEHRLRRKHISLNSETNAGNEMLLKDKKKQRKIVTKKKEKWKNMRKHRKKDKTKKLREKRKNEKHEKCEILRDFQGFWLCTQNPRRFQRVCRCCANFFSKTSSTMSMILFRNVSLSRGKSTTRFGGSQRFSKEK